MLLLLTGTFLVFFVNLIGNQILKEIFSDSPLIEIMILAISMLGFIVGLRDRKPTSWEKYILGCLSGLFLFFGCFYQEVYLKLLKYSEISYLFTLLMFLASYFSGSLTKNYIYYANKNRINQRYSVFHFLTLILMTLWYFVFLNVNRGHAIICVGLVTALFSIFYKQENPLNTKTRTHAIYFPAILYGLSSGFCVAFFLLISRWFFYPTGLEFFIYLALSFLFLSLAPLISQYTKLMPIDWSILGLVFFQTWIFFSFSGPNIISEDFGYFINFQKVQLFLLDKLGQYFLSSSLLFSLFFLFYMPFACIIPALEKNEPKYNHLLSNGIGNFLGFLSSLILSTLELAIALKVGLLFLLLCHLFLLSELRFKLNQIAVLLGTMITLSLPLSLEKSVLSQGINFTNYKRLNMNRGSFSDTFKCEKCPRETFSFLKKKYGHIVYLAGYGSINDRLGMDGYPVRMHRTYDFQKAFVLEDFIDDSHKNILLLGLGNHATYSEIQALRRRNKYRFQVDIVDMFPLFADKEVIANLSSWHGGVGFSSLDHFYNEDAFHFLLNRLDKKYDFIVWNLSATNHNIANKLYTKTFFLELQKALQPNGYLISVHNHDDLLTCLTTQAFKSTVFYPNQKPDPVSLIIASNSEKPILGGFEVVQGCESEKLPDISNFSFARGLLNRGTWGHHGLLQDKRFESSSRSTKNSRSTSYTKAFEAGIKTIVLSIPLSGHFKNQGKALLAGAQAAIYKIKDISILPIDCLSKLSLCFKRSLIFSHLHDFKNLFVFDSNSDLENKYLQKMNPNRKLITMQSRENTEFVYFSKSLDMQSVEQVLLAHFNSKKRSFLVKFCDLNIVRQWSNGQWDKQLKNGPVDIYVVSSLETEIPDGKIVIVLDVITELATVIDKLYKQRKVYFLSGGIVGDFADEEFCALYHGYSLDFDNKLPDKFFTYGWNYARNTLGLDPSSPIQITLSDSKVKTLLGLNLEICSI